MRFSVKIRKDFTGLDVQMIFAFYLRIPQEDEEK